MKFISMKTKQKKFEEARERASSINSAKLGGEDELILNDQIGARNKRSRIEIPGENLIS